MGLISKKKKARGVKPVVIGEHKKSTPSKSKLFHNAASPSNIPPVIQEATTDEDDMSNHQEPSSENNVPVIDQSTRNDKTQDRTYIYEKSRDSRARNSYSVSESNHSGRQQLENNCSVQRSITRTNSVPNSIRSSGRNSSVQSLTVIREQYCCCSKWTRCERILGVTVGMMAFIIVILIAIICILSSNHSRSNLTGLTLSF